MRESSPTQRTGSPLFSIENRNRREASSWGARAASGKIRPVSFDFSDKGSTLLPRTGALPEREDVAAGSTERLKALIGAAGGSVEEVTARPRPRHPAASAGFEMSVVHFLVSFDARWPAGHDASRGRSRRRVAGGVEGSPERATINRASDVLVRRPGPADEQVEPETCSWRTSPGGEGRKSCPRIDPRTM